MLETLAASELHVAEGIAAALHEAVPGLRETPSRLAQALARGQGDRGQVEREVRALCGDRKPFDLLLFDTDRIAEFVFESSRPPVLTGASKILKDLNAGIRKDFERQVIFSGGGEGLLLLAAGQGQAVAETIQRLYRSRTAGALTVTTSVVTIAPQELVAASGAEAAAFEGARLVSGTQAVLARLRDDARRQKDSRWPLEARVPGGRPRCLSCRDREAGSTPITRFRPDEPIKGHLCDPCTTRWLTGREEIHGTSLEDLVRAAGPAEGEESERRGRSSYTGFLYADGNSMGTFFGSLASLGELRFASQAVNHVFDQTRSRARSLVRQSIRRPITQESEVPILSLLGGGDESIWIARGDHALAIAGSLSRWIEEAAGAIRDLHPLLARAGRKSITFGAGLVLCGLGYPIRYQYELARALQKSAKEIFYRGGEGGGAQPGAASSFDFEVLTDASPLSEDLAALRALRYRTDEPGFLRTCRPYTAADFNQILDRVRKAVQPDAGLATSQLHSLEAGAAEGRRIFLNYLRYQIARRPAGDRYRRWLEACGERPERAEDYASFFIHPVPTPAATGGAAEATWIADAVELAPFVELAAGRG